MITETAARSYATEFPGFDLGGIAIPAAFVDTSFRNDACPSFSTADFRRRIFIDHADPNARAFEGGKRFYVVEDDVDLIDTDDWSEVLRAIKGRS